jgi:DNA-binding phage protein
LTKQHLDAFIKAMAAASPKARNHHRAGLKQFIHWSDGNGTNNRGDKMITTRDYKETVMARIKRDRKFARLFYAGAVEMLLEGDSAGALSRLRDLVNAEISFKELARQTGLGEKSLHRMLNRNGNPTARNLGVIIKSIAEDLGIKPRVEFA